MAKDNKSLGQFNLEGIPPAPAGQPRIDVTFEIDADGILQVSAEEQQSGEEASITIEDQARLDDDEIEEMKEDAEKHAEEDQKRRDFIEAKNKADSVVNQANTQLEEHGDEVDQDIVDSIEEAVEELKETKEEAEEMEDLEEATNTIEEAVGNVQDELKEIGKEMYGDQQGGPGGFDPSNMSKEDLQEAAERMNMGGGAPGGSGDDVVDADYEEVDTEDEDEEKA